MLFASFIEPLAQNLNLVSDQLKPVTHLAILYADRGEFDRKRFLSPIDADTPIWRSLSPIATMWQF